MSENLTLSVCLLVLCAALLLWHKALGRLLRLLVRSSLWMAALAVFGRVGQFFGVTLGANPINALVLGLLGVPGLGLLLMLQWVLRV
jgi:inhibitor of the pro-sigma K processing machinery